MDSLRLEWNWPVVRERLTILVIVGTSMDEHSLRSQVGMGSESNCLFGQLDRILWTWDSEAGVKTEKSGGVPGGAGECDDVVGLLVRERRSLDILPVKKEAKLSAIEVPGEVVGSGEEDLRCRSLLTVCQDVWGNRRLKIRGWNSTLEDRMSSWYWLRRDAKEDQSAAE